MQHSRSPWWFAHSFGSVNAAGLNQAVTHTLLPCCLLLPVSCPQPALRSGALDTVQRRQLVMNGPLKLVQGNFGTISRIPIFLEGIDLNETWGNNKSRELLVQTHRVKAREHTQICRAGSVCASACAVLHVLMLMRPAERLRQVLLTH
jgi:hypothetical protein